MISGLIALPLPLTYSSIRGLLSSTYSLMNAGPLIMVIGGIFWKKGTKEGAIASEFCGVAMILQSKTEVNIPYLSLTSLTPKAIICGG